MDFNAVYEIVAPYLGSTGIATAIVSILVLVLKASTSIKNFTNAFKSTNKLIEDSVKKVIPQHLYVKIQGVAKEEFAKMKVELLESVNEKWVKQINANTELMQAMALALCSMKAIPDSQKEIIANLIDVKPERTDELVIELLPEESKEFKATENMEAQKIIIE